MAQTSSKASDERPGEDERGALERTRLAWTRAGLSAMVSAGLVAREGVSAKHSVLGLLGGLILMAVALVAWHDAVTRPRQLKFGISARTRACGLLTFATMLVAALALAIAVS